MIRPVREGVTWNCTSAVADDRDLSRAELAARLRDLARAMTGCPSTTCSRMPPTSSARTSPSCTGASSCGSARSSTSPSAATRRRWVSASRRTTDRRWSPPTRSGSSCRGQSDMRFHWVVTRLDRLEPEEMHEFVLDAWGMVVPKFLFRERSAADGLDTKPVDLPKEGYTVPRFSRTSVSRVTIEAATTRQRRRARGTTR